MKLLRFPHPLVLLTGFILLAAALSYVLPAGEFGRRLDPATQREVVVPGSYHRVPPTPVSPLAVLVSLPRGLVDAGSVVFLIFLAGGAFTVVDQTGALRYGVDSLLHHAQGREALLIPLVALLFAIMGALENMGEEIIALVPARRCSPCRCWCRSPTSSGSRARSRCWLTNTPRASATS